VEHSIHKNYGWSSENRLFSEVSGSSKKRTTLIAALNDKQVLEPMYFDGHTDTIVFITWLREQLLPELKPGQVVIMDNASFHKNPQIEEMILNNGNKLLYLPPYSPDLNPIENY